VLAALAVFGTASACPLGRELTLDQPVLAWHARRGSPPVIKVPPAPPKLALLASVGDAAALVRLIEHEVAGARCGIGRGELEVRVVNRGAIATAARFDRITAACLERALAAVSVRRISDDTFVRVSIELR
jgi:hypothetical protein